MNKRHVSNEVFEAFEKTKAYRTAFRDAYNDLCDKHPSCLDIGDPNHSEYRNKLFGYEADEFLSFQYK